MFNHPLENFLRLSCTQSLKLAINKFFGSFLDVLNTCLNHIILIGQEFQTNRATVSLASV